MTDVKRRIVASEDDGSVLHVEIETADGQTVEGVYELIGWTRPPKDVRIRMEEKLWANHTQPTSIH